MFPFYRGGIFGSGIFFSEGHVWHEQRRFVLRYLRDFGFGRRFDELELELNEELLELVDFLKNGPKYEFEKVNSGCNYMFVSQKIVIVRSFGLFIHRNTMMGKRRWCRMSLCHYLVTHFQRPC